MTEEEFREMCRSNYAAQMAGLGYGPDGMALTKKDKSEWVSVKDSLPDAPVRYIICAVERERLKHVTTALYAVKTKTFTLTGRMARWKVTHWMPFPNPPEEEA